MTSTAFRSTLPRQAIVSLVEEPTTEQVDAGWSVREFEGIDLGDACLNRRLLTIAEAFGAQPQAPISQASADGLLNLAGSWVAKAMANPVSPPSGAAGLV